MSTYRVVLDPSGYIEMKVAAESGNNHLIYLTGNISMAGRRSLLEPRIVPTACGSGVDFGPNLILNGGGNGTTDWLSPGTSGITNGIAAGWYAYNGGIPSYTATVLDPAGNGFVGRAQQFHNNSGTYLIYAFSTPLASNNCYHFSCKFRYYTTTRQWFVDLLDSIYSGIGVYFNANSGNAISADFYMKPSYDVYYLSIGMTADTGVQLELDEMNLYLSV